MKITTLLLAALLPGTSLIPAAFADLDQQTQAAIEKSIDEKKAKQGTEQAAEYCIKCSALATTVMLTVPDMADIDEDSLEDAVLTASVMTEADPSSLPEPIKKAVKAFCDTAAELEKKGTASAEELASLKKLQGGIMNEFKEYGINFEQLAQAISGALSHVIQEHIKENGAPKNKKEALKLGELIYTSFTEGMEEENE